VLEFSGILRNFSRYFNNYFISEKVWDICNMCISCFISVEGQTTVMYYPSSTAEHGSGNIMCFLGSKFQVNKNVLGHRNFVLNGCGF
jgi:hypothetical protein